MKWKNALGARQEEHADDVLHPLYTPWGEHLDKNHVWEEYPRPQLRREQYSILNGYWDFLIEEEKKNASGAATVCPGESFRPDGQILVPFSPESLLSGVSRPLLPGQSLWYQRTVSFEPPTAPDARCLLHFQAVDQEAEVYVNGRLRVRHLGGYLPFSAEITEEARAGSCLLQVRVRDRSDTSYHARGKQKLKRGGMFYTAQSGIWQSVWYEWVPANPILSLKLTPDYDRQRLTVSVITKRPLADRPKIMVGCPGRFDGEAALPTDRAAEETRAMPVLSQSQKETKSGCRFTLICALPEEVPFRAWSPDSPTLYPLTIRAGEDVVRSYFALRVFSREADAEGIVRFCLNHEPLFLDGVLDQGYWSDGLMTAPCDEALVFDILLAKRHGFNMIRKHLKIENLRWYAHCDRLGVIVWQDMVNGGTDYNMGLVCYLTTGFPALWDHLSDHRYRLLSRADAAGRREWERECRETIRLLYNVPSLAVWGPFNEGWGQFDAARISREIQAMDPTRLVDHASGWFDQGEGDFLSIHNYFRKLTVKPSGERIFALTEYGGLSCRIDGHASVDRVYGYQKYEDAAALKQGYTNLRGSLPGLVRQGLSAAIYTQLSDIEEEVNGLVTYDRRVEKL
ncbi:MAG: glycoside hydrolase family 2 [Lachnospiraceae bacterium]|nr:glycoside hydrolase family 2 [Lachnospiraceae bacterium]